LKSVPEKSVEQKIDGNLNECQEVKVDAAQKIALLRENLKDKLQSKNQVLKREVKINDERNATIIKPDTFRKGGESSVSSDLARIVSLRQKLQPTSNVSKNSSNVIEYRIPHREN